MDEKVKHRIVGAMVLIALMAIFIPVAFKDHNSDKRQAKHKAFHIPPPPAKPKPKVAQLEFKPMPVAHVDLDKPMTPIAAVRPRIKTDTRVPTNGRAKIRKLKKVAKIKSRVKPRVVHTPNAWVVQLASFADKTNAKKLVHTLQKQGFAAYTSTRKNSKGMSISRVLVGPEIKRQRVLHLQTRLATLTHIKGMVIKFDPRVKRHEL